MKIKKSAINIPPAESPATNPEKGRPGKKSLRREKIPTRIKTQAKSLKNLIMYQEREFKNIVIEFSILVVLVCWSLSSHSNKKVTNKD